MESVVGLSRRSLRGCDQGDCNHLQHVVAMGFQARCSRLFSGQRQCKVSLPHMQRGRWWQRRGLWLQGRGRHWQPRSWRKGQPWWSWPRPPLEQQQAEVEHQWATDSPRLAVTRGDTCKVKVKVSGKFSSKFSKRAHAVVRCKFSSTGEQWGRR